VLAGPRGVVASLETERWAFGHEVAYGDVVAHAALADPPRFAVIKRVFDMRNGGVIDLRNVELLDPTTGEVQQRVDNLYGRDLLGFDPTGTRLLVSTPSSLAVVDEAGRAHHIPRSSVDGPVAGVAFSRSGGRVLLRESLASLGARMSLLDLDVCEGVWNADVDARGFVVDSNFARALVLEAEGGENVLVSLWDLVEGRRIATVYEHDDAGTQLRNLWADRELMKLAVMDEDGRVRTFMATKRESHWVFEREVRLPFETLVDLDRDLAFYAGDNGAILASLAPNTANLVAIAPHATRLCFAGTGVPVVVVDGAMQAFNATSPKKPASFELVEGPTNLVDIAPHPRGVIALDRDDCAHVVEVTR
jgi:hypothetical protein